MKKRFIDSSIYFITKYNNFTAKDIEKLKYGLEGLYLTISKMIFIFLIAIILDIFFEAIITIFLYNILRFFGFGFHADKSWQCLIISIITFDLIPYIMFQVDINLISTLVICGICLIGYFLFAPADTPKRPLKNRKKRFIRKMLTCLVGIIYSILSIFISSIRPYLLTAMIIQFIVINPILYLITNQSYNNYKK